MPIFYQALLPFTIPNTPSGLTLTNVTTSSMTLNFVTNNTQSMSYQVFMCTGTGCVPAAPPVAVTGFSVSASQQIQISGLNPSTTYGFYVLAVDPRGVSSQPSQIAYGTTQTSLVPTAPTNLTATVVSSSRINLAWTAATEVGGSINHYNVFRNGVLAATVNAPTVTFADTTLQPSTQYTYQVSATDQLNTTGPLSNSATGTTQSSSSFAPPFPRTGFMGIGTTTDDYYNNVTVTVQRLGTIPILVAYGSYGIFTTGADFEGWNNSNTRDRQTLLTNWKATASAPGGTKVLIYGEMDQYIPGNTAYQTWSNVVVSSDFVLYQNSLASPKVPITSGSANLVNYAESSAGVAYSGTTTQGFKPAQWAAYYQYYKSLNKTRTGTIPSLFSAVSANDASPLLDGVQLDNVFVDPGVAGDWQENGTQSTHDNGTYQGIWSDILANGQRDFFDTMSSLIASAGGTQWLAANAGGYAHGDLGLTQTTAGKMWGVLNYSFFEGAMGKNFAVETQKSYIDFLNDYAMLMAFLKDPKAGMLNFCLPDGGSADSGGLPWSTTQTAVNGEFQYARYYIASGAMNNGWTSIQHDRVTTGNVAYRANGVDLTWYDEYDNAGQSKSYWGQPVDAAQTNIRTWYDGTTLANAYAREFDNVLVIAIGKTGTGNATQPTGTVTISQAQLGGGARVFKRINGTQAPAVNNGTTVGGAGVTLQASRDGIVLLKVPTAPTNLSATAVSSSQINLSWTAATQLGSSSTLTYHIFRDGVDVGNTTATTFSDTGLGPSTTHSYQVYAVNTLGINGANSNSASATTQSAGSFVPLQHWKADDFTPGTAPNVTGGRGAQPLGSTGNQLFTSLGTGNTGAFIDTSVKRTGRNSSIKFTIQANTSGNPGDGETPPGNGLWGAGIAPPFSRTNYYGGEGDIWHLGFYMRVNSGTSLATQTLNDGAQKFLLNCFPDFGTTGKDDIHICQNFPGFGLLSEIDPNNGPNNSYPSTRSPSNNPPNAALPFDSTFHWIETMVLFHANGDNAIRRVWVDQNMVLQRAGRVITWRDTSGNYHTQNLTSPGAPSLPSSSAVMEFTNLFTYWNAHPSVNTSVWIDDITTALDESVMTAVDNLGNKMIGPMPV